MSAADARSKTFLGHPRGLFVLFFTEMWERMSYYGMRALLVLYMTEHLLTHASRHVVGLDRVASVFGYAERVDVDGLASKIFGLYTGLAYFTPFFGGILADRLLGRRRAIVLGASLMIFGHFLMIFEHLFFVALFVLVLGNGAFKPNISAQVGLLYPEGDPRRDGAFTLFYMGINLGAFIAPFVCGTLGQRFGWHYGFGAAGVGMTLGLVVFLAFGHLLPASSSAPQGSAASGSASTAEARDDDALRVAALVGVSLLSIFFWSAYEQQGNVLQLWAHRRTDLDVLGFSIPSTWYQSLNPLFILLFAPLVERLWVAQRARGREPTTVSKLAIGCFLLAGAYLVMMAAALVVPEDARGSMAWLVSATWLLTIGELYLSPVGLSLISRTSPPRMVGTLMGVWFFSSFAGNFLGGWVGSLAGTLGHYRLFFVFLAIAVVPGVAFWLLRGVFARGLVERGEVSTSA